MRALRTGSLAALVFVLAACSADPPDTKIIATCVVETDAVPLVPPAASPRTFQVMMPSAGVLNSRVLVSWIEEERDDLRPDTSYFGFYARWYDLALRPRTEPRSLGRGLQGFHTRWVSDGASLVGQVWAEPTSTEPEQWPPLAPRVAMWRLSPDGGTEGMADVVIAEVDTIDACVGYAQLYLYDDTNKPAGAQGSLPAALVGATVHAGVVAGVQSCAERCSGAYHRLHLVDDRGAVSPVLWGDDPCVGTAPEWYDVSVSNPWLIGLDDGMLGVLFHRNEADDTRLRFMRVDPRTGTVGPRRTVGRESPLASGSPGWQPRAVRIGDRILFVEKRAGGWEEGCFGIRVMDVDGTDVTDAPWQLPCLRGDAVLTNTMDLVPAPGGAVLVWSERTRLPGIRFEVTSDIDYREGVFAVLLTPQGQRGSEIVTVTDARSTTLDDTPRTAEDGPLPGEFLPAAGSDGEDIAVVWVDQRPDDPGIYARRVRCSLLP